MVMEEVNASEVLTIATIMFCVNTGRLLVKAIDNENQAMLTHIISATDNSPALNVKMHGSFSIKKMIQAIQSMGDKNE